MATKAKTLAIKDELIYPYEITVESRCYTLWLDTGKKTPAWVQDSGSLATLVDKIIREKLIAKHDQLTLGEFVDSFEKARKEIFDKLNF